MNSSVSLNINVKPARELNYFAAKLSCYFYDVLDDDGNNSWPEILKFLFDCASSGNAGLRESALHILRYSNDPFALNFNM